jgi:hypothetical protein
MNTLIKPLSQINCNISSSGGINKIMSRVPETKNKMGDAYLDVLKSSFKV